MNQYQSMHSRTVCFIEKLGLLLHQAREILTWNVDLKMEDGVLNPEMSQFLRLHAREDDFATTVLKARQFVDASELIKPKKNQLKLFRHRHHTMHKCIVHRTKGNSVKALKD